MEYRLMLPQATDILKKAHLSSTMYPRALFINRLESEESLY